MHLLFWDIKLPDPNLKSQVLGRTRRYQMRRREPVSYPSIICHIMLSTHTAMLPMSFRNTLPYLYYVYFFQASLCSCRYIITLLLTAKFECDILPGHCLCYIHAIIFMLRCKTRDYDVPDFFTENHLCTSSNVKFSSKKM